MSRKKRNRWTRRDLIRVGLVAPVPLLLAGCGTEEPAPAENTRPAQITHTTTPASPTAAAQAPTVQPTDAPSQSPTTAVPPTEAAITPPTETAVPPTATAPAQALAPTPACDDDDEETPAQTAGPFFTPNSPERTSLREPGITGTPMVLTGAVLSTGCQPIAGALLDFWHADDQGQYDNVGYRLRGHLFSDAQGRYQLETIVPGLYPGRTRHFHVRVQAPNQPILTTQLYFPNEPGNASDGIFHPALQMAVQVHDDHQAGVFDFVLDVG